MSKVIPPKEISGKIKQKTKNGCDKCKKHFSKASELRRHEMQHNNNKPFQCDQCQKLFKLQSSLQRHRRHNHEHIKQHKCIKCNASFAQRINLHIHQQRLHSRPTNLKCTECDSFFKSLNTLNRHKKARHTQQPNCIAHGNLVDDPKSLAELVVTQLKSLEQSISSIQAERTAVTTAAAHEELESTHETTFVEQAKFGETNLRFKLNPEKIVKTIKVQTVKRPNEPVAYVCEYCAKEFHKTYNFIRHIRIHTKELPYSCTICSSNFITKSRLEAHFKRMHILDEKTGFLDHQHKCFICTQNFSSMRKLDQHTKSHIGNYCVQYFCSICHHKFSSKTAFSTHKHQDDDKELLMLEKLLPEPIALKMAIKTLNLKCANRIFTCSICGLQQPTQLDLHRHRKQHSMRKTFKCKICGSSYMSNLSLLTHQKLHNKETGFPCKICLNRKFTTKSQLERHQSQVHQEERNFQCCYCSQRFKSNAHCKSHMKTHLKKLLGSSHQSTLEQSTPSIAQLIINEKNNVNNSPKFIRIEMLSKHPKFKHRNIQVELAKNSTPKTNSTKNICSLCDKHFQKPSDLLRHTRLHTQERPFHCDTCKKSFKLKSTLDDHQKTHLSSMERSKMNVACQVCGKSYATQKSLNVHLRLHTGKFPFVCETCGKSFRTSGHRSAHLKAAKSKDGNCKNASNFLTNT